MKKIFIYYSLSGNGDLIADCLAKKDIDLRKVFPKKNLPKNMFGRIMKGGFLAGLNHKSKLVDFDANVSEYDQIIIGSPVWNGRFSCPINTVLATLDLMDKQVDFVLYAGGGQADKLVKKINKKYPNSKVVILKEPKKYKEELDKLNNI